MRVCGSQFTAFMAVCLAVCASLFLSVDASEVEVKTWTAFVDGEMVTVSAPAPLLYGHSHDESLMEVWTSSSAFIQDEPETSPATRLVFATDTKKDNPKVEEKTVFDWKNLKYECPPAACPSDAACPLKGDNVVCCGNGLGCCPEGTQCVNRGGDDSQATICVHNPKPVCPLAKCHDSGVCPYKEVPYCCYGSKSCCEPGFKCAVTPQGTLCEEIKDVDEKAAQLKEFEAFLKLKRDRENRKPPSTEQQKKQAEILKLIKVKMNAERGKNQAKSQTDNVKKTEVLKDEVRKELADKANEKSGADTDKASTNVTAILSFTGEPGLRSVYPKGRKSGRYEVKLSPLEKGSTARLVGGALNVGWPNTKGSGCATATTEGSSIYNVGEGDFTIMTRFQTRLRGTWKRLVTKRKNDEASGYSLVINDGDVVFQMGNGFLFRSSGVFASDGHWHTVVVTRNTKEKKMVMYFDGKVVSTVLSSQEGRVLANLDSAAPLEVGCWGDEATEGSNFVGDILEVQVLGRPSTEKQALALTLDGAAQTNIKKMEDKAIARHTELMASIGVHYPFKEDNTASYLAPSNSTLAVLKLKKDEGVEVSGGVVKLPYPNLGNKCLHGLKETVAAPLMNFQRRNFSLSARINTHAMGDYKRIITKRSSSSSYWWSLAVHKSKALFEISSTRLAVGSSSINDGKWHTIVGVRDGYNKKIYLYVDGKLEGQAEDNSGAIGLDNAGVFEVGCWNNEAYQGSNYFGLLKDIQVVPRLLNEKEIAAHAEGSGAFAGREAEKKEEKKEKEPEVEEPVVLVDKPFRPQRGVKLANGTKPSNSSNSYSLMFWVLPTAKTYSRGTLIQKGKKSRERKPLIFFEKKSLRLVVQSGTKYRWRETVQAPVSAELKVRKWQHVTITHKDRMLVILIDGKVVANNTRARAPILTGDDWYGGSWGIGHPSLVADVRYASRVLEEEEISEIISKFKYSEAVPTPHTMVSAGQIKPKRGQLLVKQGVMPSSTAYTWAFWVRVTKVTKERTLLFTRGGRYHAITAEILGGKSQIQITASSRFRRRCRLTSPKDLPVNQWVHIGVRFVWGELTLFIDGERAVRQKQDEPNTSRYLNTAVWGTTSGRQAAEADLADVRYYDVSLKEDEIGAVVEEKKR